MASEILGIHQSDLIIRSAIVTALQRAYDDPTIIDAVFKGLAQDPITKDQYGEKQAELAKHWILNQDVPVFMNVRVDEDKLPCIAIALQDSSEAEYTIGDVHHTPQEEVPMEWPPLTRRFTPLDYSPTSGIMQLPADVAAALQVAPGMFVVNRDGRAHVVVSNLDDGEIALTPYTVDDFTDCYVKGAKSRMVTTIESINFKETYLIGVHAKGEPDNLIFLHSLVKFLLLKYKQDLLEARNFERSVLASTDFRRNPEFNNELVFSRYISITGYARQTWPKKTRQIIDSVDSSIVISSGIRFSSVGSATELPPVAEDGNPPGPDDAWSVIPAVAPPAPNVQPLGEPQPDVSALRYWFEADAGIVKDGSNLVSNWVDHTGNGWDLQTPAGGNVPPVWAPNQLNNRPGVYFGTAGGGGASDWSLAHYGGPFDTVSGAYPPGTAYPFSQNEPHVCYVVCVPGIGAPPGGGVSGGMLVNDRNGGFARQLWTLAPTEQRFIRGTSGILTVNPAVSYVGVPLIIIYRWTGTDMFVRVNGSADLVLLNGGVPSSVFAPSIDAGTSHVIMVGGSSVDQAGFQGTIHEVMLEARPSVSAQNLNYLKQKWGISF